MTRKFSRFGWCTVALASLLIAAGCEGEKKTRVSSEEDGGISDKPAVDPSLAKAMAAASAKGGAAARQPGGPPATGVFEPGAADKEMPKGAPPKITVGSEGSEPRIVLGTMQPAGGFRRDLSVQLALRSGPRQGLPPVDFVLGLAAQKPKAAEPGGAAPAGAAKPEEPGGAGSVEVTATVKGVKVSQTQTGVPKDLDAELSKLKGSRISFRVGPNGAGDAFRYELGKASGLELVMRALTESLATFTLPYPDKPVGTGAYWMATTRETAIGTDVIAYRIVKVEEAAKDKLKLSVNTKRYATSSKFDIPELPKDAVYTLEQFDSQGEGEFEVAPGTPFPAGGEATLVLNAGLSASNKPDQRVGVQSQTRAAFELAPR